MRSADNFLAPASTTTTAGFRNGPPAQPDWRMRLSFSPTSGGRRVSMLKASAYRSARTPAPALAPEFQVVARTVTLTPSTLALSDRRPKVVYESPKPKGKSGRSPRSRYHL